MIKANARQSTIPVLCRRSVNNSTGNSGPAGTREPLLERKGTTRTLLEPTADRSEFSLLYAVQIVLSKCDRFAQLTIRSNASSLSNRMHLVSNAHLQLQPCVQGFIGYNYLQRKF